tara:strand:- start:1209 stop:1949 length:741 start_codon:yes stop_codon:yes gene_type:complete
MNDTNKKLEVLKVKDVKKKTHPLDKKLHVNLPRHPFLQLMVAPPKSGKSNLIMNMLFNVEFYNAQEYWEEVMFISPTAEFDNTLKNFLPELENCIRITDPEEIVNLEGILREICRGQVELKKKDEPMKRILIIMDDCISFLKPIAVLCSKYRHYNLSIIITSQSFRSIPLITRNCAGSLIMFHLNSGKELEKITEEHGDNFSTDFETIARKYTEHKYEFIMLNNEEMRITHGFNEVICDAQAKDAE